MSTTHTIDDNDFHALRLLREKMGLENEIQSRKPLRPPVPQAAKALTNKTLSSPEFTRADSQERDRIEQIDYALEAWAKGENILVAMLADPREVKLTINNMNMQHVQWSQQMLAAQQSAQAAITQQLASATLAKAIEDTEAALDKALQHFGKAGE